MKQKFYQIAIDGPAGSGKSTIAKLIAKKLNFLFINTGGMFRCCAIALQNTNLKDKKAVSKVLKFISIDLKNDLLFLNGVDVTKQATESKISLLASDIGKIPEVRTFLLKEQRKISQGNNVVIEGRDTTTCVFPNAILKVYMTASIKERARRRWEQLKRSVSYQQILDDIIKRDYQDTHRKIAPLKVAKDAFIIEEDDITVDQAADKIINKFKELVNV